MPSPREVAPAPRRSASTSLLNERSMGPGAYYCGRYSGFWRTAANAAHALASATAPAMVPPAARAKRRMGGRRQTSAGTRMDGQSQIVIERVNHTYRPPRGRPVLALSDVSLNVRPREFLALLGPSGCGKSTLLYLVGGFLPIEAGRIAVKGKTVTAPGPDRGIVFQHFALFPWKTVRSNILYGLERQGMPRAERERRAQAFIDLVGLSGFENSYPSQLSGGMKQRTAIARTLA